MRRTRVFVGAVVATMAAAALAGCGSGKSGLGRLTVNGQVEISSGHGKAHPAASGNTLKAGDQVHVIAGSGAIRLASSGLLELRAGSVVVVDKSLQLTKGAVLIEPASQPISVMAQNATLVVPSGAAQLSMGSVLEGLTAKVYQDRSNLEIPGNPSIPIAAPRQVSLTPETKLPVQPKPLVYQDSDGWDHQYLAPEVALSTQLAAAAAGFDAQLMPNQGRDAAFYRALLPNLTAQPDFAAVFAAAQRVTAKRGDYLIASVIALRGTRGSFATRMSEELTFLAQGASWGFVAHDQGLTDLNGVLNDVLAAIRLAPLPLTGAPSSQIGLSPPTTTAPPTTTVVPNGRPVPPPPTTTTVPRATRTQPTTPTTVLGPPLIQLPALNLPPPLGSILNPLLDPLIALLNSILGGGRH